MQQKCELTKDCAMHTFAQAQLIGWFLWSPEHHAGYSHLWLIDGDVGLCLCGYISVSNGSSFRPGRFYWSAWQRPYPIKNRRFFKRTIALWLQISIREFSVWHIKYVTSYGASFGRIRFSISSNLSMRQPNNLVFGPKMAIISKQLAEFWRYQKSETTRRCTVQSCIFHTPNTKLCDEVSWT